MAADRFTFFISFYKSLKELSPEDFKLVITAMCEKVFFDRDTELEGHVKALYTLIEPVLLKTVKTSKERSEQGKKGGAPIGNTNALKQANSSKNKQIQTDKEKEIGKGNRKVDIEEEEDSQHYTSNNDKRFIHPSVEEVRAYCTERNNNINPEYFVDYYNSNGWKVGSSSMKDWKATVRNWERNDKSKGKQQNNQFMTNNYTTEDFEEFERQFRRN